MVLISFYALILMLSGSEKLVRGLFAEAEAELAACNGDATRSALHVVVIDEIDAVFRRRSAGEDSGEQTRVSSLVADMLLFPSMILITFSCCLCYDDDADTGECSEPDSLKTRWCQCH